MVPFKRIDVSKPIAHPTTSLATGTKYQIQKQPKNITTMVLHLD